MPDASLTGAQALLQPRQPGAVPDASTSGAQNIIAQYAPPPVPAGQPPGQVAADPYLSQQEAANEAQAKLEQEHGRFATVATQAARGALDFVMAPAALLGAGLEGAGAVSGWQGLRDFGRDFGQDAQGSEAMATLFNPSLVAADSGHGLDAYQAAKQNIAEQQQAWPLLSTVSHAAGMVAASAGVGLVAAAPEGAAAAGTALGRVGGVAAMGATEGAASGAQDAYSANRPLRDVLGATLMGGLMGGITAGALQGASEAFSSPAAAEALEGFSRERASKALGIIQSTRKQLGGADEVDRLVKDVSGYVLDDGSTVLPKTLLKAGTISQSEIADRISQAADETGAKLGNMRRSVSDFIDTSEPSLRPKLSDLDGTVGKIAEQLEANPQLKSRAADIRKVLEHAESLADENGTISLNDLRTVQDSIKRRIYPANKLGSVVPEAKEELQQAERSIEDTIEGTVDKALPKMGVGEAGAYRDLRRVTRSFIQADKIAKAAVERQIGNRAASLTDTMAGTATFAGDLATGGPVIAGAKALGVTALHKYAREHGSMFLSALTEKMAGVSRRLASGAAVAADSGLASEGVEAAAGGAAGGYFASPTHDSRYVSVDAAGGRDAQQVIATFSRARDDVNNAVEAAGPNPVARSHAQQLAQQRFADELASKAGPFDPVTWRTVPPNPLQKVLHRSDILNQVSSDLAASTAQAQALRPDPNFALNPDRVRKLTKDANGPLAIGGVQANVRDLVNTAPPTPTGDQIKLAARGVLRQLSSDDTAGALMTGHDFANQLTAMAGSARDQLSQDYVSRVVTQLRTQLSDPSFGKAGQLYGKLTGQPDPNTQSLTDPNAIREALRTAQSNGEPPAALRALTESVTAAHDAKKQFGGGAADREVGKQLADLTDQYSKAQDAVTLDGGPAGRVFDFFSGKPGADARGLRGDPTNIVLNAVRPQMERLLPVLGKENDRYTGAEKPSYPEPPKSSGELQSLYRERMDNLAQSVASPDPDAIAQSLKGLPNIAPDVSTAVATDSQQRMATLLQDMPKPTQSIRGKAFETLSSDDLRKANAMWEATTKPMSVFADFHAGTIDYDKAQYAWKQYPGLQQAAQAGLMDALHAHLSDDERAAIPDSTLTQLDYLLGFNGTLQTSVDRGFAARMTALGAQDQDKPQQNGPLELETSKPTYTERLAGAKG